MKFLAATCFLALTAAPVQAAVLDLQFEIDFDTAYDYPTGAYVPYPFTGTVNLRMDLGNLDVHDYGDTTISSGPGGSAVFDSPLTKLVGPDPLGPGLDDSYSYVFPHTSAYSDLLIEQVAAQTNAYSSQDNQYWAHHAELRIDYRSFVPGGALDYAMTLDDMLRIVGEWYRDPSIGYFNESSDLFSVNDGQLHYTAGMSWSDYSSTLRAAWLDEQALNLETMEVMPAPVPLPAAIFLLLGAMGGLGAVAARRKSRRAE
jgi:hypothetical protein